MLDANGHYFALLLPLLAACAPPPRDAGADALARPHPIDPAETEARAPALPADARAVLEFWLAAGPGLWFAHPRNAFRGTPRMYESDAAARAEAERAVAAGFDRTVAPELQPFVILPFGHSESLADQERSVVLCRRLGAPHLEHAEHHLDIVRRFGRFPHRNAILGRVSTRAEQAYLENGGYRG